MSAATASSERARSAGARARAVVLHVTESYGAGTGIAIQRFVRSVPEAEHHLLRRVRSDSAVSDEHGLFASVTELPAPGPRALQVIRGTVARIDPTSVHLHSSIGGALGRAAVTASRRRNLVYSPHCYAFEREDLHPAARLAVRAVESLLSFNTSVTAACSPREAALARRLRPGARAVFVPNVAPTTRLRLDAGSDDRVVFTVGRAGPQKDPEHFARIARAVRAASPDVRFVWIGGGDAGSERSLRDAGVEVTGWLSADDGWPALPAHAIYLHTAAWEGYPLSILEAQAAGLPIAARRIPALSHLADTVTASEETRLTELVQRLLRDPGARRDNIAAWAAEASRNSAEQQRAALLECYGLPASTS